MPTRTEYKHGTFSWVELATANADAAKKFYSGLFGWTFNDMPVGPGMTYSMAKVGSQDVAALYTMGKEMQGIPPNWLSYVTVNDIDATAKKVAANGGKLIKEPFDVMDAGRMAVVQDPTGAVFALWKAKKHIGAGLTNEPGSLTWTELFTNNIETAKKFYVQTIGWATESMDMGPMGTYTLFQRPEEGKQGNVGGMMNMPPNMKGVPPHWLAYFQVTSCDASTKKVAELGGKVLMQAADIPNIGRFSVVQDPQGAAFALFEMRH